MAMGVGWGKMRIAAFNGPSPQNPYRHKNLADISYTRQVVTNFVSNLVAMAMGADRGKMQIAAFNGPFPKPPHRRKNLADIFYIRQVIANFVPNFVAMATGGCRSGKNVICSIQWPIPENPPLDAKILQISLT